MWIKLFVFEIFTSVGVINHSHTNKFIGKTISKAGNLFNKDYFEQLLPAGGNAGHYAGVLGDPRTYGLTLKFVL